MNAPAHNFDLQTAVESEMMLIGGLLRDTRRIDAVADIVKPADFAEPFFGAIYSVILDQHARGDAVTILTLRPHISQHPGFEIMGGNAFLA
ncbi:hypothetical protein NL317_28395, partial [Klebsiella pneumoniae]|nr:hypothetical protein [Klebsiella pneumoniae]